MKILQKNQEIPAIKKSIESLNCNKHGKFEAKIFTIGGTPFNKQCPKCEAESEAKLEKERQAKIAAFEQEQRAKRIEGFLSSSNIPLRYQNKGFRDFEVVCDEQKSNKQNAWLYAKDFEKRFEAGSCAVFSGKTGTGKTHLACAIGSYVIKELARSVLYITAIDAFRKIKNCYSKGSTKTESEILASLTAPDLLILDEIGVQFGSETEKMILFEIINKRYEAIKPSLLISNLKIESIACERTFDRIKENIPLFLIFNSNSKRK